MNYFNFVQICYQKKESPNVLTAVLLCKFWSGNKKVAEKFVPRAPPAYKAPPDWGLEVDRRQETAYWTFPRGTQMAGDSYRNRHAP